MKAAVFLVLLSVEIVYTQPVWVNKTPSGYLNDFFIGKGFSKDSKADALDKALASAISSIINSNEIRVSVNESFKSDITEQSDGKISLINNIDKIIREITITGESSTIRGLRQVENYYDETSLGYDAWTLVSLPKKNPVSPPNAFSPVWRSLLLPGWGQIYKEETFKGLSFMVLTIGSLSSGFICKQLSNDANNKAFSSRTQARRDYYNNDYKNYNNYSLVSFVSAAAFYTWSLLDAIIVKQNNLYVFWEGNCIKFQFCLK